MKKLFFILSVLFICTNLSAQSLDTLSTEKEAFVKEMSKLLEDTKKSELKDLTKKFNDGVKKGEYSDEFLLDLAKSSNILIKKKGRTYPHLSSMLSVFMKMNSLKTESSKWNSWISVLNDYMNSLRNGDTKKIIDFLTFSEHLYEKKALTYSKGKSWYFTAENFKLKLVEKSPVVELELTEIIGATKGDSITIQSTLGSFDYVTKKWSGKKGWVDWQKAGIPEKEVYCTFDAYEIDMNTQYYKVPNVQFIYKGYFSKIIKGSLYDKLTIDNTPEKSKFPRFEALKEEVPPQNISDNMVYKGGFTLAGSKILGATGDDEKSELIIYALGTKQVVARAFFNKITISKPEKVTISDAVFYLYFEGDSIFHPKINLQYKLQTNVMKLTKGDGSLSETKYWDSYHKVSFDADVIIWDLNKDYLDINTVSTSGLKSATYESKDFFNKRKMREIRGNVSYDPLSILSKHQTQTDYNEIIDEDFAKIISPNLTVKQIQPLLFRLIREGFISWDEKTGIIVIHDKVKHYVKANVKKKDYDNISMVSKTKQQNARLNLKTKTLNLEGIKTVPISIATTTQFFPDSSKLKVNANRDMLFNGFMFCGRLDFFGKNNEFKYDEFKLNIPEVDTMIINIPDGDKLDAYGNPVLRPLNTVIENLSGNIEINHPKNKSGRVEKLEYPKLTTSSNSKVFFDAGKIRSGTYSREKFYYTINPFSLDSLQQLTPQNLSFAGKLNSAGIFPEINEPLRVQPDLSLGFNLKAPADGFDLYQGKGKFYSDISLNGKGLSGDGKIEFKTVSFESRNIEFFPDSLFATADIFDMKESKGAFESPLLASNNNPLKFYPYRDSLWVKSNEKNPFSMYNEVMKLEGSMSITNKGVGGEGTADWDDATLISNGFVFKSEELLADTAELIIKSLDGDKVTFNTPNVNAAVDFSKYTGYFKSNTADNRTEFGYNQYETSIDEFFWDINEKRLEFNAKEGSEGEPFTSLHPEQDSLTFLVQKANLDLQTSIIEASGVEEILVADSRVIPNEGKVTINPVAKLNVFKNAIIEANAESKKHRIEKAIIDIRGKNDMKGSGSYVYKTKDTSPQYIEFPNITVALSDSSVLSKKRKGEDPKPIITGKGIIAPEEDFILYPNVTFYGDVSMFSSYDKLKIKGFTKIDFKSDFVRSDYYEIDSEVDPENLRMDISKAKDPSGSLVRTGIFISKSGLNPIYTEILNSQIGPLDISMIEVNEILSHKYKKNVYVFGSEEKISNPEKIMAGNILEFDPQTGEVHAEGTLDLGTKYGVIKEKVAGTVDVNLNDNEYKLTTSISFPFQYDKDLLEKMAFYLLEDNFDLDDADYSNKKVQFQLAEFFKEKDLTKLLSEADETGVFNKPKSFKENLLLSDVDLFYDNDLRTFRSKGKFNLVFVGEKGIHKRISGYIELGHRMGADFYRIYLKTSLGDWIYISFEGGANNIEIISSFDDINALIESIDIKKRTIKGEKKDQFIIYTIGSEFKAKEFAKNMKAFATEK